MSLEGMFRVNYGSSAQRSVGDFSENGFQNVYRFLRDTGPRHPTCSLQVEQYVPTLNWVLIYRRESDDAAYDLISTRFKELMEAAEKAEVKKRYSARMNCIGQVTGWIQIEVDATSLAEAKRLIHIQADNITAEDVNWDEGLPDLDNTSTNMDQIEIIDPPETAAA